MKQTYDAILVPGGGVLNSHTPTPWVQRRLDKAIEIANDAFIIALSAGTTHKPPVIDHRGFPVFESVVSAHYLMQKGYDPSKILIEHHSYDTIGNAFFARMIHTDPKELRKLAIVTSEFHMERTQKIFDWIFHLPPQKIEYSLNYIPTEDHGIRERDLESRIAGEQNRINSLEQISKAVDSLSSLHSWLFEHHDAYAVGRAPKPTTNHEIHTY